MTFYNKKIKELINNHNQLQNEEYIGNKPDEKLFNKWYQINYYYYKKIDIDKNENIFKYIDKNLSIPIFWPDDIKYEYSEEQLKDITNNNFIRFKQCINKHYLEKYEIKDLNKNNDNKYLISIPKSILIHDLNIRRKDINKPFSSSNIAIRSYINQDIQNKYMVDSYYQNCIDNLYYDTFLILKDMIKKIFKKGYIYQEKGYINKENLNHRNMILSKDNTKYFLNKTEKNKIRLKKYKLLN